MSMEVMIVKVMVVGCDEERKRMGTGEIGVRKLGVGKSRGRGTVEDMVNLYIIEVTTTSIQAYLMIPTTCSFTLLLIREIFNLILNLNL